MFVGGTQRPSRVETLLRKNKKAFRSPLIWLRAFFFRKFFAKASNPVYVSIFFLAKHKTTAIFCCSLLTSKNLCNLNGEIILIFKKVILQ